MKFSDILSKLNQTDDDKKATVRVETKKAKELPLKFLNQVSGGQSSWGKSIWEKSF